MCQHPMILFGSVGCVRVMKRVSFVIHVGKRKGSHVGHDVTFYRAHAGGCCDCGDANGWYPQGFC